MKKLISLFITIFMLTTMSVKASNIEVQPTMQSRSNAQDRVWVGTFQLVWNEFIFKFIHNPVRFREGTPQSAFDLNQQDFTTSDISEKCYYKYVGYIKKNTKQIISKAIKKKFKESSDILAQLNMTPGRDNFIIYTMLKKDFEFLHQFDKLGKSAFRNSQQAEYFGINAKTDSRVRDEVQVLYYNNQNDFAIKLATKGNDEVYLYKNNANKSFNELYDNMQYKTKNYKGDENFNKADDLKVPNIKFDVLKSFDELTNKRIMGTNLMITQALESIKFDMNNKGVELKSEAAMIISRTSLAPEVETSKPRHFYLDDTFVIFLQENNKSKPYFALRVHDITNYQ